MAPRFGTSGLRGLVAELTPDLVADHVRAFLRACPGAREMWVGQDLRPSSPDLVRAVAQAARGEGVAVVEAGAVPTPALARAAMEAGAAAVMVTGSHIPADRNGLKFYTPRGEITKAEEGAILAALGAPPGGRDAPARAQAGVAEAHEARVAAAWGEGALAGMRVGVWEHSTVARDGLHRVLRALGAETVGLGRSGVFVPVDTEAVDAEARARIAEWVGAERLDALVSADGDADRPLVAGEDGAIVPGDVLGPLAARALGAEVVVTPVSSNGLVEGMGFAVRRTRIGSPYVIAAMEAEAGARVAGYEANGGFLLGFAARGPAGPIAPLMTRDALVPIVAGLAAAREAGGFAALRRGLPARFTAADRLEGVEPARAGALLAGLEDDGARGAFLSGMGLREAAPPDRTDGLRMRLEGGEVLHLRPSGNAPEFRVYAEADDAARAGAILRGGLAAVARALGA